MRFMTKHDADMASGWARHHDHDFPWHGDPFGERERERHGRGERRRGAPMFGRGDLKFALLELLADQPKHGYEMIKALEERSGGFYTPSAGAIYPTLQMMEDIGWVTSQTTTGKKVYAMTEQGQHALHEHMAAQHPHERGPRGEAHREHSRHEPHAAPELHALHDESKAIEHLMRAAVRASRGDPAVVKQLQGILGQARDALSQVLNQLATQQPATPPTTPTVDDTPADLL